MKKSPERHMLSVDMETREAVERLEAAAESLGWSKSELVRFAVAAMCDYLQQGGTIQGAGLIPGDKVREVDRIREIARTTGDHPTKILRELVDAIEPVSMETGALPRPIRLRVGPLDAKAERITGMLNVLRRNIRDLETLLE
jgi:hypothetical protein